jgi:hypothetical protein
VVVEAADSFVIEGMMGIPSAHVVNFTIHSAAIAQSAERATFNRVVKGSSPFSGETP